MAIVGIDCACDPTNIGLALALWSPAGTTVVDVRKGSRATPVASQVAEWLEPYPTALLALDAPLGWPEPLGRALSSHCAGAPIRDSAHKLFRRETDRFVKCWTGKQPLDVGADRIARTAHAALKLLGDIRELTGKDIPLAWKPHIDGVQAIEVYPAATLIVHGLMAKVSKGLVKAEKQAACVDLLAREISLPEDRSLVSTNPHCLDAVVCVLAAVDFLKDKTFNPTKESPAHREGWIWVADPAKLSEGDR